MFYMSNDSLPKLKKEPEELLQKIDKVVYNVDFPPLDKGRIFDYDEVQYYKINEGESFRANEKDLIFTVSVDGSEHSEFGMNLVLDEFLPIINNSPVNKEKGITGKFLVNYVYYSTKNNEYNYANSKDTIICKYSELIGKYKLNGSFYIEDRWSKKHALEQVVKHTEIDKSNFLIVGYFGIKGPKCDNKELSKGVDFLLGHSVSPTILIKENSIREKTKTKGFLWAFIFENQNRYHRYKILEKFLPLVDPERDTVHGICCFEVSVPNYNPMEKEFLESCQNLGLKNYHCDNIAYSGGNISYPIIDKVNHGKNNFNFVVFSNNLHAHIQNPEGNDYLELIRRCSANICFLNY